MPPKSGQRSAKDWSWVGTEVNAVDDIKLEHRRRAAGLAGEHVPRACTFVYGNPTRAQMFEPEGDGGALSDASVIALPAPSSSTAASPAPNDARSKSCQKKACRMNPRCYNHLGAKEWLDSDCRDKFIMVNIGDEIEKREGPAGLKNYGATCYANAFLQVWFNNVSFRNGVYQAVAADKKGALFHLASIFGMLQHSERKVVDPGALIDALRLNKGYQQDAAEFSKLFMSLLNDEFRRAGAQTFVSDQFEGTLEYRTLCNTCGYISSTDSPFLELEISLANGKSLENRITELLLPEVLDGANKYRCPSCVSLQSATRSTHLKALPPVLHFSLMRFAYDPYSGGRKKSKASITYPRSLELNKEKYDLRGVVTHQGKSALHGHFVCEVFNESEQQWYWCSDDEVNMVADRPRKRAMVDTEASDESQPKGLSSCDAYMLVYKRVTADMPPFLSPPDTIMDAIKADNVALITEMDEREKAKITLGEEFDHLSTMKREVLESLPGTDCLVPTEALQEWFKSRNPNTEWDFTLMTCVHGNINPEAGPSLKPISRAAFSRLSEFSTIAEMEICDTCVRDTFAAQMKEQEHEDVISMFDSIETRSEPEYMISKNWYKDWRAGRLPTATTPPTDPQYTLFCEHQELAPGNKTTQHPISAEGVEYLCDIFGVFVANALDAPTCDTCAVDAEVDQQERAAWSNNVRAERHLQKELDIKVFGSTNFLLPKTFYDDWTAYLKRPGKRPELDIERCPHGRLDFDPQLEPAHYMTQNGWDRLCRLYSHNPSDCISVRVVANIPAGKKLAIEQVSLDTCAECRSARLSDFEELWVTIVRGRAGTPDLASSTRRRNTSSSRSKQWSLLVKKDTSIKFIRNELYEMIKVSPKRQKLFLRNRELESDETIGSIGFLEGDHLALEEVVDVDDIVDLDGDDEEGFGGTVLIGRVACPQCTFENAPGAEACDICEMPFQ